MFNASIVIRKEYMKFTTDKNETVENQGIRVILGPKVEKFFTLENISMGTKSSLELLGYTNPNLVQWYFNSPVGSELTLKEIAPENSKKINIKEIYSNSENLL